MVNGLEQRYQLGQVLEQLARGLNGIDQADHGMNNWDMLLHK